MDYKIFLKPWVKKQIKKLDSSVAEQVLKKIRSLSKNPYLGKPLGHKIGMN